MQYGDLTQDEIQSYFRNLDNYLSNKQERVKYIDIGCKVIRLISYSDEIFSFVQKQLTYVLKDTSREFSATLVIWNESDFEGLVKYLFPKFNPKTNLKLRVEMLALKQSGLDLSIIDRDYSKRKPVIEIQTERGIFSGSNLKTNRYYYGVRNLEPEEFIKEGHIFVQFFSRIFNTRDTNLVHGAVIGLNGRGILLCAGGQRGKSTLAVVSLIRGYEYVADDYLILQRKGGRLLANPIYSIITLSPEMYNRLYDDLEGFRFVSNNARKDKYVFNISSFHKSFRRNYPVRICIFPEIKSKGEPLIYPCEKGRAITQFIHSTLVQTGEMGERDTVRKLINMVKDFEFYKFELSYDIERNTEYLRDFMDKFESRERKFFPEGSIYIDTTYNPANILNTETGIIYSINEFGMNIFENMKAGVPSESIKEELKKFTKKNPDILSEFEIFREVIHTEGILEDMDKTGARADINEWYAEGDNYGISVLKHAEEGTRELITGSKEKWNELCIK